MNKMQVVSVLIGMVSFSILSAVPSKTDITVEAQISTSIQVYANRTDVTGGNVMVRLEEDKGYMTGETPPFFFIGNATSVDVSLEKPANGLVSQENPSDTIPIIANWIRVDGGNVSSTSPLRSQTVYQTLADIPDPQKGVKVNFRSSGKAETYALGNYSGTYIMTVKPNT